MSDPKRTPDIVDLARLMPERSALIYRHFGKPGLETELRTITRERGVQLLIGNDPELAETCQADGVHFSRRTSGSVIDNWRETKPDWIISAAWIKSGTDDRPLEDLDALLISAVFESQSPSAGTSIGVEALSKLAILAPCPVFALGGIDETNAAKLRGLPLAGLASIGGLADILRTHMQAPALNTDPIVAESATVTISKEEGGQGLRFVADVSGSSAKGELTLRRVADGVYNANHTGVPSEIGGRGVGKALVAAMVEDARQQGYRVVPGCPFVAKLFERKPEWGEVAA